jgi:hypothetical protein
VVELAEALGGQRFDGLSVSLPEKSLSQLRDDALKESNGFWPRFGRWFFTRGPERTISPSSKITVGELERLRAEAAAKNNSKRAKAPPGTP